MKKIFWTTIFWLIVFFGFAFYMKMFDANMAAGVSTWLGATTITTSGEVITTGAQSDVMSGITTIQTTLTDMQTKLDKLVGTTTTTTTTTPVVTPVVDTKTTVSTGN
jgi:hypothetical protein